MRRLLALFLLSLPLVASAREDEKGLQKAIAEWQTLFQPLKEARMVNAGPILDRIAREAEERGEAIRTQVDTPEEFRKWLTALGEGVGALEGLFARSSPQEQRILLRYYAIVGDSFEDSDVPNYPTCGTGLSEQFDYNARLLFLGAVEKEPAAHLGLLDDPDPRVAELAAWGLHEAYPEEVRSRIVQWASHRQARFRGIAAIWAARFEDNEPFLGEGVKKKIVLGLLDDPSEDVRDQAVDGLTTEQVADEYRVRVADFGKAREGRKWTALRLGARRNDPTVGPLALSALSGSESLIKAALQATCAVKAAVPKPTLLRLLRHSSGEVRELAYQQAAIQDVTVADIQRGFADPVREVADAAFDAACQRTATRDDFILVLRKAEGWSRRYWVTIAAGRLGGVVVPDILPLLADSDPETRVWGVEMACLNGAKPFWPVLQGMVVDPSGKVKKALMSCASDLPKPAARELLKRLAQDADAKNREEALRILAELDAEREGER